VVLISLLNACRPAHRASPCGACTAGAGSEPAGQERSPRAGAASGGESARVAGGTRSPSAARSARWCLAWCVSWATSKWPGAGRRI